MWLSGFDFVVIEGEGGRKNQRENRWAWGRAEGGRRKEGTSGGNRWTWGRAEKGAHEQGASPGEGLPNGCV